MMDRLQKEESRQQVLSGVCDSGSVTGPSAAARPPGDDKSRRTFHWIKWGFTAFMLVLVPYYWMEYGPTNFLYFCDIALFLALASLWTRWPLFASMALVGLLVPQLVWQLDFVAQCVGLPHLGLTNYMFDPSISLFARFLSFFHFWLPILLIYVVHQLGFDRRSMLGWTLIAWIAVLVSFTCLPAPGDVLEFPNQPHNVNYVYGFSPDEAQTWLSPNAWLMALMIGLPMLVYLPTYLLLKRWMPTPESAYHRAP